MAKPCIRAENYPDTSISVASPQLRCRLLAALFEPVRISVGSLSTDSLFRQTLPYDFLHPHFREKHTPPGLSAALEQAISAVPRSPDTLSGCIAAITKISVHSFLTSVHAVERTMSTSLVEQFGS